MAEFRLLIGSKNSSSWSMRAWLAMRRTGADFDEDSIVLDTMAGRFRLAQSSPSRQVPLLRHGATTVWDSLAIIEYLAELFPGAGLWPSDRSARAYARSICAEMHAGFYAIRRLMPMDARAARPTPALPKDALAELKRLSAMWRELLEAHAARGSYLFGTWSAADAFYAPVASRLRTYAIPLGAIEQAYVDRILAWPDVVEWVRGAEAEARPGDEPDTAAGAGETAR